MKEIFKRKFLNPLWIIVIFCSLTEITLGYAVFNTDGNIQLILTGFVVGFPLMIAIFFFLIVWFKPGHLYAPMDFKEDQSFLDGISNNSEIPVNVYLDTNDEKAIEAFNNSFKQLVEKNKLAIVQQFPPKKGSWIAKFRVVFKEFISESSIKELTTDLVEKYTENVENDSLNQLENKLEIEKKRIEIEQLKLENIKRKLDLIKSMSELVSQDLVAVDNVAIRMGSLVVIKTIDEKGKPVINNYVLDEFTQALVDQNVDLLNKPSELIKLLEETQKNKGKIKADNKS